MSLVTASITVLKTDPKLGDQKTHPQLNPHWFGNSKVNESLSLEGSRILEVIVSPNCKGKHLEASKIKGFDGCDTSFGAVYYDEVYISFASFEDAETAFKTPSWPISHGVELSLNGMLASIPTRFMEIKSH